ncbi:MAG TPA: ABC transporter permease [Tepidisphaeraceae bacterium]|jgi:NitT/TauT family transport system permease protein
MSVRNPLVRWLGVILPPLLVLVVITAAAEVLLRWLNTPAYLVPRPSQVWETAVNNRTELLLSLWKTAQAALIGFGASAVVGVLIAIILSTSRWVQRAFYPYTVFFQTVPIVAIAPLLVIWFEAGLKSVATCAFVVSVFPVIANTLAGLLSTDPALRDLFRLYGASAPATMFKLRLPYAMPSIITGLRIAAGLAVIGTIVGEFVAGLIEENPGLGILVGEAKKLGRTDLVFAAVLTASLLGLLMLSAINVFGYIVLRHWHASAQE